MRDLLCRKFCLTDLALFALLSFFIEFHLIRAEDRVLPLGWLAPSGPLRSASRRLPFPVHIQALLGTLWVMWLFRLVGLWWLVAALLHLARRLA